jgi:hypothetical protein
MQTLRSFGRWGRRRVVVQATTVAAIALSSCGPPNYAAMARTLDDACVKSERNMFAQAGAAPPASEAIMSTANTCEAGARLLKPAKRSGHPNSVARPPGSVDQKPDRDIITAVTSSV